MFMFFMVNFVILKIFDLEIFMWHGNESSQNLQNFDGQAILKMLIMNFQHSQNLHTVVWENSPLDILVWKSFMVKYFRLLGIRWRFFNNKVLLRSNFLFYCSRT